MTSERPRGGGGAYAGSPCRLVGTLSSRKTRRGGWLPWGAGVCNLAGKPAGWLGQVLWWERGGSFGEPLWVWTGFSQPLNFLNEYSL